ncbi:hypothetical protein GF389_06190 [Candidatus Dojkabacteria bacterium]|nr:hypothetical protein [Candidatus Dojkabacteria bacterium]
MKNKLKNFRKYYNDFMSQGMIGYLRLIVGIICAIIIVLLCVRIYNEITDPCEEYRRLGYYARLYYKNCRAAKSVDDIIEAEKDGEKAICDGDPLEHGHEWCIICDGDPIKLDL